MSAMTTSTTNKTRKPTPSGTPSTNSSPLNAGQQQPRDTVTLTHAQIAQRAYEIYRGHNGQAGDQLSDWLQAERELRGGFHPTAS